MKKEFDVVGFTLEEARALLKDACIDVHSISVTSPPKSRPEAFCEYYRVVNVKKVDEKSVELIVCKPI
ncbi:MAG: hypothetical protein GX660_21700 [Clostridiaceae bacterium]|nr:hypothetical protein [Clostridiaceae bacterium]